MKQILKKICDHPLLLTKRAAEDVLEEMDTMLKPEEVNVAEKLAMYIADAAEDDGFEENHVNISCKISFILSLLVRHAVHNLINELKFTFDFFALCYIYNVINAL